MMKKKVTTLVAASLAALTLLSGCRSPMVQPTKSHRADLVRHGNAFPVFPIHGKRKRRRFRHRPGPGRLRQTGLQDGSQEPRLPCPHPGPEERPHSHSSLPDGDVTDERKKTDRFHRRLLPGGYTIVVPTGNTDITGYDSIAGKTVGAQVGSKAADYAREHRANVKELTPIPRAGWQPGAGTRDANLHPSRRPVLPPARWQRQAQNRRRSHCVPRRSHGHQQG